MSQTDLIWAIRDLTKAIEEYTKTKKRGIELAEQIEERRHEGGRWWE